MGYKPEKTVYNLEFADREGLEVSAKSATLGEIEKVQKLRVDMHEQDEAKRMELFNFFSSKLIKWNVEHPDTDDGGPCAVCGLLPDIALPATTASMMCLDLDFVMEIIIGWVFAVARVSAPKGMSLKHGESDIPEEVRKRLETLQNPVKLPTPNFS